MNDSTAPHQADQRQQDPRQHDQRRYGLPFFNWLRGLGIVRSDNRWLAGVCGALSARTGLDPLIIRGVAIVIAVLGGPIFFFYAVAWALLPDTSGRIHAEQVARSNWTPAATGIMILTGLSFIPFTRGIWWQGAPLAWGMPEWLEITLRIGWTIALVVGFLALVIYVAKRVPANAWRARDAGAPAAAGNPESEFVPAASFVAGANGTTAASTAYAAAAPSTASAPSAASVAPAPSAPSAPSAASQAPPIPFATEPQPVYGTGESAAAAPASGAPASAQPSPPNLSSPRPNSAWDQFTESEAWKASVKGWTEHRMYHLGAGFVSIVLGLAAVAGAIVAVLFARGEWSEAAFLVGGASALAVIGVGAIIAGIRGKQSGALNFFAIVLVAVLAWTSFFPKGTEFIPFGAPTMSYSQSQETPGFAIIAGAPIIDLRDAGGLARDGGTTVDVWLAAGDVELVLPRNTNITVETNILAGATNFDGAETGEPDRGGVFLHDRRDIVESSSNKNLLQVRVWVLFGQSTINALPSR